MSIDAIAVLPVLEGLSGRELEGGWLKADAPADFLYKPLKDATLVMLGMAYLFPDAELYEQSIACLATVTRKRPRRIWIFPDTAVPELETGAAIKRATKGAGRWVAAGPRQTSFTDELGLTPDELRTFQKEVMSGDPARVAAAIAGFEQRLAGREDEIKALLKKHFGVG